MAETCGYVCAAGVTRAGCAEGLGRGAVCAQHLDKGSPAVLKTVSVVLEGDFLVSELVVAFGMYAR